MHHNKQENTKKTPIFGMNQMNRGIVVAYNLTGSYIMITDNFLGI